MTDAPRTTRLKPVSRCKDEFDFYVSFTGGGTEYIRKDISDARIAELEAALDWAYTGEGLDKCALQAQAVISPFQKNTAPDHAVQVAIRVVIDAIRARAALKGESE